MRHSKLSSPLVLESFPHGNLPQVALPGVSCTFPHQSTIKKMPHRHAYKPVWHRHFLYWVSFSQVCQAYSGDNPSECMWMRCMNTHMWGQRRMSGALCYPPLPHSFEPGSLTKSQSRLATSEPLTILLSLTPITVGLQACVHMGVGSEPRSSCLYNKHSYALNNLPHTLLCWSVGITQKGGDFEM